MSDLRRSESLSLILIIAKLSPSSSSSWAELALFSANPTYHPYPPPSAPPPGKVFLQLNLYPIMLQLVTEIATSYLEGLL